MTGQLNSELISVMEELVFYIGLKGGNGFKKRAFEKALDALIAHGEVIVKGNDLKGIPNIGKKDEIH